MKLSAASIFLASASLACADWVGWNPDAYSGHTTTGVVAFASNQVAEAYAITNAVTYTNEVAPGVFTTLIYRATANVRVDIPPWGQTNTYSFSLPLTRYIATTSCVGSVCTTSYVATVTNYAVSWTQPMRPVTVKVQARDAWAIDAVRALRERAAAAGGDPYAQAFNKDLYSQNRDLLVLAKATAKELIPSFVNTNTLSPVAITNAVEMLTVTGLLAQVGAPSNYLDYTSWAQLGGAGTNFEQRVTTRTMVQSCSGTNACTNYAGIVGVTYTNVATNGAVWAITTTNANILAGYSSRDYGWMYLRPVLEAMTHTAQSLASGTQSVARDEYVAGGDDAWDNMLATNTAGICGFYWATTSTNYAAAPSWSFDAASILWEDADASYYTDYSLPVTNAFGAGNIITRKMASYKHRHELHANAASVVSNMAPALLAYQNRQGDTNFFSSWPFSTSATKTNVSQYYAGASGNATVSVTTNGVYFYGPAATELNIDHPDKCAQAWGEPDGDVEVILSSPNNSFIFGGNMARFTNFAYQITPLSILNWGTTNGFRYR